MSAGPWFNSQYSHQSGCKHRNSSSRTSDTLVWPLWAPKHVWHTLYRHIDVDMWTHQQQKQKLLGPRVASFSGPGWRWGGIFKSKTSERTVFRLPDSFSLLVSEAISPYLLVVGSCILSLPGQMSLIPLILEPLG